MIDLCYFTRAVFTAGYSRPGVEARLLLLVEIWPPGDTGAPRAVATWLAWN